MSSTISSLSFYNSLRAPIQRLQQQISQTQQEISSGRRADVGLDLGAGAATSVALRNELGVAQATIDANKSVAARLDATQTALASLASAGQTLQQQLVQAQGGSMNPAALQGVAASTLQQIQSIVNSSFAGGHLFGGTNSVATPLADYAASPKSAASAATANAFQAAFGVAQGSAGAASISGSAMQSFLDGQFSTLFNDANWKSNWSTASDTPIQSRIDGSSSVATSVSANESGIRDLTQAVVMLSDLGLPSLGSDARASVVAKAIALTGQGLSQLTTVQASVGETQNQTAAASSYLTTQSTYLQNQIGDLENVDPAQASIQLTTLSTQLQSAYSLTSRMSQLSLLKYI